MLAFDSVELAQRFFGFLALAAIGGALVLVVASLLRGRSPWAEAIVASFAHAALPLAWLVAAVSMAGSLYFSEVADYTPCTLCWYQRIAMYPLVVILGIATIRRDRMVKLYVVPLAAIGAVISIYHVLVEQYPSLESGVCSVTLPCDIVWFRVYGFVTLPFMALCGFSFIIVSLVLRPQEV